MPVFVSSNNNVAWKHVLRATNTKSSLLTENRVEVDKLQVIPNPTNGITKIVYLLPEMVEKATIEILSEDGIMVYKTIVERTNTTIQLDLSPFSSGLYSVRLIALGKIIETKSLIIK